MNSLEEADHFSRYLEEILSNEALPRDLFDVEYVGLGVLRVHLDSGTAVIVIVTPASDDTPENEADQ
jgi:hypothetical protein